MPSISREPKLALPRRWPHRVRSAVVRAVSIAKVAFTATRSHAEHHFDARVRLQAENDRLRREVSLLLEELRVKDARMERLPALWTPGTPSPLAGKSLRPSRRAYNPIRSSVGGKPPWAPLDSSGPSRGPSSSAAPLSLPTAVLSPARWARALGSPSSNGLFAVRHPRLRPLKPEVGKGVRHT